MAAARRSSFAPPTAASASDPALLKQKRKGDVNEDKACRYHRLKRQAGIASLLWGGGLLMTLLASGLTLRIRTTAESIAPGSPGSVSAWIVRVLVYVTLLSALNEAGSLPIAFYSGFLLARRYGLGTERLSTWLLDHAKSFALGLLLAGGAAVLLYAVIAWLPNEWWLVAGVVFAIWINRRHEDDILPVRRPDSAVGAGRNRR